jgi:avidin family protein
VQTFIVCSQLGGAAMLRFVFAFFVFAGTSASAFAQTLPVPSYWLNQRGSELKIFATTPPSSTNFAGVYLNHAAGFKCQASPTNPPYAVTGHTHASRVTFTVVWNNGVQNCKTTTIWRGHATGKTLTTHWVLFGPGISQPMKGADVFQLQP